MLSRFYPDEYVNSVYDVDYDALFKKGKRRLIFDIDNTLVPHYVPDPTDGIVKLMKRLAAMGFLVALVSNNRRSRVEVFNKALGLPVVHSARKPLLYGLNKALALVDGSPADTVFIGDQVFTDIWCGRRRGLYTVLVKPVVTKDEFTVRLKRGIERKVIDRYLRQLNK